MATVFYGGHLAKGPEDLMEEFYRKISTTRNTQPIIPLEQVDDYVAVHNDKFTAILWAEPTTHLRGIDAIAAGTGVRMLVLCDDLSNNKIPNSLKVSPHLYTQFEENEKGGRLKFTPCDFSRAHGFFPHAGLMTDLTLQELLGYDWHPEDAKPELSHLLKHLEHSYAGLFSK